MPPPGEAEAASAMAQVFEFVLSGGFLDESGELHRVGAMRLPTALDQLEPLRDDSLSGPDAPRSGLGSRASHCVPLERWRR
jgi:hypothetical protein